MASVLLALPPVSAAAQGGSRLAPPNPDLVAMVARPTAGQLTCSARASLDTVTWRVSRGLRGVQVRALTPNDERDDHQAPLPFAVPPHEDRAGDRHVLKVSDGWLVGFDRGEFGGALWFTTGTNDWRAVTQPQPAGASDRHAENVHAIVETPHGIYVLVGLDHLTGRYGRLFRAAKTEGQWRLSIAADLDSSPQTWAAVGPNVEFVTEAGLWRLDRAGARIVARLPLDWLRVNSFVVEGARRWLGMNRYVLALDERLTGWGEHWFAPRGCAQNTSTCECRP